MGTYYYGGTLPEESYSVALDAQGSIFITGFTESLTDIATPGAHQTVFDTDVDAFLAKFIEVELPALLGLGRVHHPAIPDGLQRRCGRHLQPEHGHHGGNRGSGR
ncbi:MAG: hypothetical protein IPJ85_11725 [Flavobacteriales bacterium]|nr:hypothetical protein [Flavobacteriales bacterium]